MDPGLTRAYTFGDSEMAAERLALVAEVFAEASQRLMVESIPAGAGAVLDLGCGPGHTTRLLAGSCAPRRVLGVDASVAYVALARRLTVDPRVEYAVADVTDQPLPEAPADAVYARFLLTHLPDPDGMAERWCGQLRPGGVLVLDELDDMDLPPGPLCDYERLAAAVVAAGGGTLYAGEVLRPLGGTAVEVLVPEPAAARMFALNLPALRPWVLEHGLAEEEELSSLATGLGALASGRAGGGPVRWVLRQLTLGR